jgi:hypothetical protein
MLVCKRGIMFTAQGMQSFVVSATTTVTSPVQGMIQNYISAMPLLTVATGWNAIDIIATIRTL